MDMVNDTMHYVGEDAKAPWICVAALSIALRFMFTKLHLYSTYAQILMQPKY